MKVVVAELHQESNSFCPKYTGLEDYERYGISFGKEYRERLRGTHVEGDGTFVALEEAGIEYVPSVMMRAQAGGTIKEEVYRYFIEKLDDTLDATDGITGVFLNMHGATQSTASDDVCGDVLEHVRSKLGDSVTISVSFDLHANCTRKIFENANVVCGYQSYPHVDFYETGYRAGKFGIDYMTGKCRWKMAMCSIPMIQPASGYSTESGGLGVLMNRARALVVNGTIGDFTVFEMQPWLDVYDGGSSVVMLGKDEETLRQSVLEISTGLLENRYDMVPELHAIDEVLDCAERNDTGKPIILVDFSDSSNAGAAGDNSDVLKRIVEGDYEAAAALIVVDGECADLAAEKGVGYTGTFEIGGKIDKAHSTPVKVVAAVRSIHDGEFKCEGPGRGTVRHVGVSAVVTVGHVDILVTHAMASTGDPQLYRHFGIEPSFYKLIMVKANTSFYAGYDGLYSSVMAVDTGCAATSDLKNLPFKHLPRSFYPFSDIGSFDVGSNILMK